MRIGIDISQLAYPNTGVANYLQNLVIAMLEKDNGDEYVLFYSSLRRSLRTSQFMTQNKNAKYRIVTQRIPPTVLSFLWNRLHIMPVEWFVGDVDVFITSDWTEPPARRAKKVTIIYDMIIYKYPEETHNITEFNATKLRIAANIVEEQKRRLHWVEEESDKIFTISEATKRDIVDILKFQENKVSVIYPGLYL